MHRSVLVGLDWSQHLRNSDSARRQDVHARFVQYPPLPCRRRRSFHVPSQTQEQSFEHWRDPLFGIGLSCLEVYVELSRMRAGVLQCVTNLARIRLQPAVGQISKLAELR